MENSKLSQIELDELFPKNIQSMIQPRYSLLKEMNETKAKTVIIQLIKQIPNYENKIKDLEMILMVCLYIENLKIVNSQNKKKKIDKAVLFVSICHELFNISPESQDMNDLKQSAQFLKDHKKVVKFSFLKKLYLTIKNYFTK
tara:strand:+ start:241 stop:669 length:429 start_codon:yes stop_codon:yes gene_type:complete